MKLNFSDKPPSTSSNKKVQFQGSPMVQTQDRFARILSEPPKPRPIFSSTLRKDLFNTFDQVIWILYDTNNNYSSEDCYRSYFFTWKVMN